MGPLPQLWLTMENEKLSLTECGDKKVQEMEIISSLFGRHLIRLPTIEGKVYSPPWLTTLLRQRIQMWHWIMPVIPFGKFEKKFLKDINAKEKLEVHVNGFQHESSKITILTSWNPFMEALYLSAFLYLSGSGGHFVRAFSKKLTRVDQVLYIIEGYHNQSRWSLSSQFF